MERRGIRLSDVLRDRRMPCHLLRLGNQVQTRSRQGRHVQRLANVASCLRPIRMVVEKRAARGKVKQRHATQNCQRAPRTPVPEDRP